MYKLIKVSVSNATVYYDRYPMHNNGKGADWLSLDARIKTLLWLNDDELWQNTRNN